MSTMAAPPLPLPIDVELFAGGDWRSIPGDVYQRNDITISYGLPNEATSVNPCSCTMTLGNLASAYDPTNPTGPYYGTIGRNTPLRINIRSDVDRFNRTVANGWGTSTVTNPADPTGDVWQTFFSVGNSAASYAVNGSGGTHTVSGTAAFVASRTTAFWGDVDVAVTVSVLPGVSVTGGTVEPANILLRGQDGVHYYMVRVSITTAQQVTIQILDANSFAVGGVATVPGLTHSSGSLRVRAQAEGSTIRGKVWDPSGPEPSTWATTVNYYEQQVLAGAQALDAPGFVGVRSGVGTGNTNTNPVTFTYDDFVVRVPRFAGWAFLQPTTDISGQDKTVSVTAGSVLRQLSQGSLPLASPLRHDIPSLSNLLAYWPCEDAAGATSFASGISSAPVSINGTTGRPTIAGQPMQIAAGSPQLAADSTFVGSAPLPVSNGSYWYGFTGSTDTSGIVQARFLIKFPPAATLTDQTVLARLHTTGSVIRWDIVYFAGGGLGVSVFDTNGNNVFSTGGIAFNIDGLAIRLGLSMTPSGGSIAGQLAVMDQGIQFGVAFSNFTVTSQSITTCYAVAICPPGNNIAQSVVGHITVQNTSTGLADVQSQFNAFTGEDAGSRLSRLRLYASLGFQFAGSATALSMLMGPQQIDTVYNLIQSVASSDGGLLYEAKGDAAIAYKSGGGHALGPADPIAIALSRTTHDLGAAPAAAYDDQNLHNDYTVTQQDGSSIEVTQTTGPLSTATPPVGVGTYATSVSTNLQTPTEVSDLASWLLHLGTVASARYPQITVNMLRKGNAALYWPLLDVAPDEFLSLAGQTPDTILLLARGYTETLNAFNHQITFNCAPGEPYLCPVLDDGVSRLDAATSTLSSTATATAVTLGVASADGSLWSTNAGDYPQDITIGGERITVTGVTGTSTPQVFAVTRSVNGVVKGHAIGEAVDVAKPLYLALGR